MKDEKGPVPSSPAGSGDAILSEPAAADDVDRIFLLECRLDQLHSALHEARAQADQCRARLADAAAREAEHARGNCVLQEEVATARREIAALHRRLEHSEALRAELGGRAFESGARDDADELVRLRREARAERERRTLNEDTVAHLQARVDELAATRETLLTRVTEWQRLVRRGDPEAIDLGEFIAALRSDILELEHRSLMGERREAALLARLGGTGERAASGSSTQREALDLEPQPLEARTQERTEASAELPSPTAREGPTVVEATAPRLEGGAQRADVEPTGPGGSAAAGHDAGEVAAALAAATDPEVRIDLLLRLGRSGETGAFYAVRRWAADPDPRVRAAAYESLGRLLERDPSRLEPYVCWGLADADARVRRRVILTAATARGLPLGPLLEPFRGDPDPQVRRVVHEVLRRTRLPAGAGEGAARADGGLAAAGAAS